MNSKIRNVRLFVLGLGLGLASSGAPAFAEVGLSCADYISSAKPLYQMAVSTRNQEITRETRKLAPLVAGVHRFFLSLSKSDRKVIKSFNERSSHSDYKIVSGIILAKVNAAFASCAAYKDSVQIQCLVPSRESKENWAISGIVDYSAPYGHIVIKNRWDDPDLETDITIGKGDATSFDSIMKSYLAPLPAFKKYAVSELGVDPLCFEKHTKENAISNVSAKSGSPAVGEKPVLAKDSSAGGGN